MPISNELDYKKHLNLIRQHKKLFIVTALLIMTVTVIVSYLLPKKYEAKSTVFIEKTVLNQLVQGFAVTPSMDEKIKGLNYAMGSRPLLQKVAADLDLDVDKTRNVDSLIAAFQKDTQVELKDKENLFTISFVNEDPKLARDYVNTLVRRYIEENVSSTRAESYGASKFLSEQISVLKEKMAKAEEEVSRYRRENGTVVSADPAALEREIANAQLRADEIQLRRAQLEANRNLLKKRNPAQSRLQELEKKLADMRVEYTDSYPEVIRLKSEIESVREQSGKRAWASYQSPADQQELERIDAELRALRTSESKQYSHMASARALLHNIPAAKAALEQLERDKLNQKNLYDQLMTRHGQSEFSKQMEVQDKATTLRVVDPAVLPTKPISPNRVAIILMGIGAGIVASFGLLLVIDYYDQSVKSLDSLKSIGLPVLAVIPKMQIPAEIQLQKSQDVRLYAISACYFSLILVFLLLELMGIPTVETSLYPMNLKEYLSQTMSQFK